MMLNNATRAGATLNPASACMAGLAAQEAGDGAGAVAHFERALSLAPALIDVRLLLAFAQGAFGDEEGARKTLNRTPDVSTLPSGDLRRLADAAVQLGAIQTALKVVRLLMEHHADDADLHATYGALLQKTGSVDEAAHVLQRAVLRWPNHVPSLLNSANLLVASGGYNEALRNFDRAIRIAPSHSSARWHRGMLRLTMGDFAGGWRDYEARRSLPVHTVKLPKNIPAWDGKRPAGRTLLLWGEQGLGDQIQGVRFAAHLAALGAMVVVRCASALTQLFETVEGVSRVVADDDATPNCDAHVPMLSVPFLLKWNDESMYGANAYVHAPRTSPAEIAPYVRAYSPSAGGNTAHIGVAWAGSPGHINDANRSLPATALPALLSNVSAQWVSLQVGNRSSDLGALATPVRASVVDVSSTLTTFVDTAHVLSALDRVVTVDTAVAHLAGALGVPTLLLVPFVPDWRWQLVREESPWYSSVRLIRQTSAGDWTSVIERVHRELAAGGQARAA